MNNIGRTALILLATTVVCTSYSVYSVSEKYREEKEKTNRLRDLIKSKDKKINELDKEIVVLNDRLNKQEEQSKELKNTIDKLNNKLNRQQPTRSKNVGRVSLGSFEVTAYDDSPRSQGKWVGKTATGVKPQKGVVAVDPKVIPLGTRLYVEGYGECIAGDTGGAIKGKRIDVFYPTYEECRQWGRRTVQVYRLD